MSGCIHDGFLALLNLSSVIERDFLYYFFLYIRERLNEIAPHGTQKNLNTGIAKKIEVPVPRQSVQKQIIASLDKVESLRQRREQANQFTNKLIQSVFLKMFGDPLENPMRWKRVPFVNFARIERSGVSPEDIPDGTKYVGLEHIQKESGDIIGFTESKKGNIRSSKFTFTADHVLYGKLRPYLNKVALPDFSGVCSTDILPVLPRQDSATKYFIAFLMKHPYFVSYATEKSTGANLPRVSPEIIERFETPLPPFDLQEQFARFIINIQKTSIKQRQSAHEINELFQSLISKAFRGKLNPRSESGS
jgi:type I restriction enzyme S subunit